MIYVYLLTSCIIFIELFVLLNLKKEIISIIAQSRDAVRIITSAELDDEQKETLLRRASLDMFKVTFSLLLKFILIAFFLTSVYWLFVTFAPELKKPILDSLVSPIVVIGLTVFAVVYVRVRNVFFK